MALRLPFVLDHERALHRIEPGVARAVDVKMTRNGAIERRNCNCILDQRAAVGRAQLQRRIDQRRADGPPDEARILDDAGAHQRAHIGIEFIARAEELRHAGAGQLVVGGKPVTFQAGAAPLPERRGRRECKKERKIRQHPVHDVDPVIGIRQLHMHVHPAQEIAPPDHLQIVHHDVVALLRRRLRTGPQRARMRAGRENAIAMLGGDRRYDSPQLPQLATGIAHADVRR